MTPTHKSIYHRVECADPEIWDLKKKKNWGKYADSPSKMTQGIKVAFATLVIFDLFFAIYVDADDV